MPCLTSAIRTRICSILVALCGAKPTWCTHCASFHRALCSGSAAV